MTVSAFIGCNLKAPGGRTLAQLGMDRLSDKRGVAPLDAGAWGAQSSMIRAFANKHWHVNRGTKQLLLRVSRTEEPFLRLEDIAKSFAELEDALRAYNRRHFCLLVDMRAAPQRNDPEFEQAASHQPAVLSADFIRVAVLVRTASGRLQVGRHIRTLGISMMMFNDEAQAMLFLFPRRT
jgi:hypothetical protein